MIWHMPWYLPVIAFLAGVLYIFANEQGRPDPRYRSQWADLAEFALILGGMFLFAYIGSEYDFSRAGLSIFAAIIGVHIGLFLNYLLLNNPPKTPDFNSPENKAYLALPEGDVWGRHPDWPQEICEAVAKKELRLGMTMSQIAASQGWPSRIERYYGPILVTHLEDSSNFKSSDEKNWARETWIYYRDNEENLHIEFDKGMVRRSWR